MIITNMDALTSHGNVRGRKTVLDIMEAGFQAADPYENVRRLIRVQDDTLIVGHPDFSLPRGLNPLTFDLSKVGHIYVVGGGKAAQKMAQAMEDVLGPLITEGQINAKKGEKRLLKRINVTFAGHPIPDEASVEGSKRILEIETKAKKGDIVFFAESGGGTSLMTLPGPEITLEDLQQVTRMLYFEGGASIRDANAVRWQLMILRGRHGRHVGDATFLTFHTDERPPGSRVFTGNRPHAVPTNGNAISVLKRYEIWDRVPQSVRSYLLKADPQYDRIQPGELKGKPQYHYRVMGPEYMLDAATRRAQEVGVNAVVISSSLSNIEASSASAILGYMAQEARTYGRPLEPPCVFICGGELLVTVGKATGLGGRNQEFALSTASRIDGDASIVIASADSDGTDGPTNIAGGIVDGYTVKRAQEAGIDVFRELENHNSSHVLQTLGDVILTGALGTNVQDLRVVYVEQHLSREELLRSINQLSYDGMPLQRPKFKSMVDV